MSVFASVSGQLSKFVWDYLGEEQVHDLGGVFLGVPYTPSNPHFDRVDEVVHNSDLFTAWLWADYREQGKSMLELFADSRSNVLTEDVAQLLRQMIATQVMSLFRVGEHRPGNIELEDIRTGVHYHVREYSAEKDIETGHVVVLRLCQQDDHWEIIMPNGSIVPVFISNEKFLQELADSLPERPTIQDTFGYMTLIRELGIYSDTTDQPELLRPQLSKHEAAERLRNAMQETGVDRYISPETVMTLMDDEFAAKELTFVPNTATRILIGLSTEPEQRDLLMPATMDYWNSHVSKRKVKQLRNGTRKAEPLLEPFYPDAWLSYATRAQQKLNTDPTYARQVYDDLFVMMLEQHMAPASLYRLLANAAVAYLAGGDLMFGAHLLEKSLALCPNYDFAQRQQQMLEDGAYLGHALAPLVTGEAVDVEERFKNLFDRTPPPKTKLRKLSDKELLEHFSMHGVTIDPKTFVKSAAVQHDQLSFAESLVADDKETDYIYGLLGEARERWAPKEIWPDTIHDMYWDLENAMYPSKAASADYKQACDEAKRFATALTNASDKVIQSWVHDAIDYVEEREALVHFAQEAPNLPGIPAAFTELCTVAYKRTQDPIFRVPEFLDSLNEETAIKAIDALAKELPLDHATTRLIGDCLIETHPELARHAYELSLAALDRRYKKRLWQYSPYSYAPLREDYEDVIEHLSALYFQLGDENATAALQVRLDEIRADERLEHNESTDKLDAATDAIIEQDHPDSPILAYMEWFDTLGITLADGDRQETRLTVPNHKIGRNEPCPCGAKKPDGTPVKYKKCHGQNA